jgi:Tfp pilus assembly protein PilO
LIVISLAAAGLWWYFWYRPAQEGIAVLEADIATLEAQIIRGQAAQRNLPELREVVAQLEQDRIAFLARLPKESEVAALLDALRITAENEGVTWNAVSRGGGSIVAVEGVRPLSYSVNTTGSYEDTIGFLSQLENLQRFTRIDTVNLGLANDEDGLPILSSNYNFSVYVFIGEDPGDVR